MSVRVRTIEEVCAEKRIRPGTDAKIAIVALCGVTSIPKPPLVFNDLDPDSAYIVTDNIVLKPGYYFVEWTGRKKEGDYKAVAEGEEDAEYVNVTGNMFIPLIEPVKSFQMNNTLNTKYLVLIKDRNQPHPRILGEIGNGVRIKFTEQVKPKNGYVLELIAEELDDVPFFYAGAVPLVAA